MEADEGMEAYYHRLIWDRLKLVPGITVLFAIPLGLPKPT